MFWRKRESYIFVFVLLLFLSVCLLACLSVSVHLALSPFLFFSSSLFSFPPPSSFPSSLPHSLSPKGGVCGATAGIRPSSDPPSLCDSADEYFDASDNVVCGGSSSEVSESGLSEATSSNSEPDEGHGG